MLQHSDHVATSAFLPHGFCYLWNPALLVTHVSADLLIGISYVMISIAIAIFVHRASRDIPFSRVFIAFGLFIVLCGMTHFVEVVTIWQPMYWTGGILKVGTAAASVATAFTMPKTVPAVLSTIRDARLREDFRRIERAQKHLLSLITDILDFARIEAGNATFVNVEFPVSPLVEEVVAMVSPQLTVKQHTLRLRGLDDATVFADRDKTSQVLTNLLANANHYTENGGQITVTATTQRDTVTIAVQDTGCGVQPEKLEVIFDAFVQADTGLTRAHQGAGLGLAISRQRARGMAGDITVTSTIGVGSVFSLSLPRAGVERAASGAISRENNAPEPDVATKHGVSVVAPDSAERAEEAGDR